MSENRLKIEAGSMDLELSGDADYVIEAYEAIRKVAMERFEQTLREAPQHNEEPPTENHHTNPHFPVSAVQQQVAAGQELVQIRLKLVVCTDMYRRIAALPREDFANSLFGHLFDARALAKIYISEEVANQLQDRLEFEKTLWRELTEAGKAALRDKAR